MQKIAIATDSNSGIKISDCYDNDIFVLPMPFIIDGKEYEEEISLSQEEFYSKLEENATISTSQPSLGAVADFWETILKDYDEIVYIPMSSGLSGSTASAITLSNDYPNVYVVDNNRISVTQKQAVYENYVKIVEIILTFNLRCVKIKKKLREPICAIIFFDQREPICAKSSKAK